MLQCRLAVPITQLATASYAPDTDCINAWPWATLIVTGIPYSPNGYCVRFQLPE